LRPIAGSRITPKDIPVIWLRRKGVERLGLDSDHPALLSGSGETDLFQVHDTAFNVLALLPGETDTTMIIGAHYDHLGYGGPTSRYRGPEPKIHYGADDNGSGVAAMLELARYFSAERTKPRHSILFAGFTGEEAGLLGSTHFVRHHTVDSSKIRMFTNIDMVGRMREQDKGLAIFGTGTCEQFKEYFENLDQEEIKLALRESGIGPSDHTAFYNSSIPVLFFFTGAHEDYHSPSDVIEKIDPDGTAKVADLIANINSHFDTLSGSLTFSRTKSEGPSKRGASYSVSLGVMPDYISDVKGLRVDGVSPDRPGQRAGMLKGDVIIRMGEYAVDDIYAYMSALSKFRKNDVTTILVERGADTLTLTVEFK
jgi:hypothetical protein